MTENEKREHSKAGIASFVLAIITSAFVWEIASENLEHWFNWDDYNKLRGALCYGVFPFSIFSIILGVVGVRQKNKNHIYAIIGLLITGVQILYYGWWFVVFFLGLLLQTTA